MQKTLIHDNPVSFHDNNLQHHLIHFQLSLIGQLSLKEIGKDIITLTDESEITITPPSKNDQYAYELLVTNTEFQENKHTWNTLLFPISSESQFRIIISNGITYIVWERNRQFFLFEILIDANNKKNKEPFLKCLSECIVSSDFQMSLTYASQEESVNSVILVNNNVSDINKYLEENYQHYMQSKPSTTTTALNDVDDLSNQLMQGVVLSNRTVSSKRLKQPLCSINGYLYNYNHSTDTVFKLIDQQCKLCIYLYDVNTYQYVLTIEHGDDVLDIFDYIDNKFQYSFSEKEILWLTNDNENKQLQSSALSFIFENENSIDTFKSLLIKCKYENATKASIDQLNQDDISWLNKENIRESQNNSVDLQDIITDVDFDNNFNETTSNNTIKNKFTTQAYIHDRTFSIRDDNSISVYKTIENEGGYLNLLMNLPPVQDYTYNKPISLRNGQMFNSDTNILFLDKYNPNIIYQYDIPTTKIVSEWEVNTNTSNNDILNISLQNKMAQMSDNPIVYGVNGQNIFALDSRLNKKNKVVDIKTYKTNPLLQCIATTDKGYIVVGSEKGEIRLFNDLSKNAKNVFPCYGDAIKGIDVTTNGKYVLATCDRYLMVIKTEDKKGTNGFENRLGKDKAAPITLKVNPFDLEKYHISKMVYTPAKFNVNNKGESIIITSLGEFVIVWNFNKIKNGVYDCYKIKHVGQYVIDNHFKYNKDQIVVTMDTKLGIQNQKLEFK